MKKIFSIILTIILSISLLSALSLESRAEDLSFTYSTKAEAVSCYIWRGLYCGGLSFQPDLSIGWTSEHTSFDFGTWWNMGASDWGFRSGLPEKEDCNPNTYFIPESDVYAMLNLWGAVIGFTHYYYFDGQSYFNFGDVNAIKGSAQTEVTVGYDFSTLLPNVNLQLMWNTMVSGQDAVVNGKRCYSTYIEAAYCQNFKYDISLTGVVGISPWRSNYTDADSDYPARDFAVNNLTLRLDKTWSLCNDTCELDLYIQGTMNTCNLCRENAFIKASGDNKLNKQKLMGAIGVAFSFGNNL